MLVDLHTHSTASDGQYRPAELVRLAGEQGIEAIALTDHDTLQGLPEAIQAGRTYGIRVVCGIELSAEEYPNLHILGHGVQLDSPALNTLCAQVQAEREKQKYRLADFLERQGIAINLQEVESLAAGGVIGRPHFAQVMVRHGYVRNDREAFARYLDTEAYRRMERVKPAAQACIQAIVAAGGQAALAHPYQLQLENGRLEELLRQLKSQGLTGLECHYPKHTQVQTTHYLNLAKRLELHITAGSDFHGERVHPGDRLIPVELDMGWLSG